MMSQRPKVAVPKPQDYAEERLRSTAKKATEFAQGLCSSCGLDITGNSQRVEIAIPSSVNRANFTLKYDSEGVAKLHAECWTATLKAIDLRDSRRRLVKTSRKSSSTTSALQQDINHGTVQKKFGNTERSLLKEVADNAEFYDSMVTVGQEAIRIARLIKSAKHCIAFTGAGISTAAGIGDYRGKSGKWTSNDLQTFINESVMKEKGHEETPTTSVQDEEEDGVEYENLRPTYTHEALKKLLDLGLLKYVISQNGDGLHKLSGIPSESISELHGNVFEEKCEKCEARYLRSFYTCDDVSGQYYEELEDYGRSDIKLPRYAKRCKQCKTSHRTGRRCEKCRGFLMDTIINFGDDLEWDILEKAEENAEKTDLIISLGTTMAVTPANYLITYNEKAGLVICNRQKTDFDYLCKRKTRAGVPTGARVNIDCDILMKFIMSLLLKDEELQQWEGDREQRMKTYDSKRLVTNLPTGSTAPKEKLLTENRSNKKEIKSKVATSSHGSVTNKGASKRDENLRRSKRLKTM